MSDQRTPQEPREGPAPLAAAYQTWWTLEQMQRIRREFWSGLYVQQHPDAIGEPNKEQREDSR